MPRRPRQMQHSKPRLVKSVRRTPPRRDPCRLIIPPHAALRQQIRRIAQRRKLPSSAADNFPAPLRLPKRPSRPPGDTHNRDSDAPHAPRSTHPPPARPATADTTAASCPIPAAQSQTPAFRSHTIRAKTQNSRSIAAAAARFSITANSSMRCSQSPCEKSIGAVTSTSHRRPAIKNFLPCAATVPTALKKSAFKMMSQLI